MLYFRNFNGICVSSKIQKILNKYDYEVEVIPTKYKRHAIEIVKNLPKVDLVMSFGGDGTFNEVMTGNFKRKEKWLKNE